jgi:hypothetical protein
VSGEKEPLSARWVVTGSSSDRHRECTKDLVIDAAAQRGITEVQTNREIRRAKGMLLSCAVETRLRYGVETREDGEEIGHGSQRPVRLRHDAGPFEFQAIQPPHVQKLRNRRTFLLR